MSERGKAAAIEANKIANEIIEHMARGLSGSWHMQDVRERRRRLTFVAQMSVASEKIKEQVVAATAWMDWAIEGVITGDLPALKTYGVDMLSESHFVWSYREVEGKRLAEIYAPFRELAQQAHLTALPRETV